MRASTGYEFPLDFRSRFHLFCAPSPPPAPDYRQAAESQGQANIDAARTQARLNNPNIIGPYGSQTVTWGTGFDQAGYDAATQKWNQQVADYTNALNQWRANGSRGPFTKDVGFGAGIDPRTKPVDRNNFMGLDQATIHQTLTPDQQAILDKGNQAKLGMTDLALQGTNLAKGVLGKSLDFSGLPARPGDATDTRNKVLDAMMSRVNEDTDRKEGLLKSNLLASGIPPGSKAYNDAMALEERNRTDARNQAFLASGQEAQRDFNMDTQNRQQALAELLTERQTPINEITALMSGSQINNPFVTNGFAQNNQVAPAPLYQATSDQGGWNADLYNAKAAQAGNLQQGLFGLGQGAVMGLAMSDRRLKSNIVRIGDHPLGIGWYEYDIEGRHEQGVMAQELLEVMPEAVMLHPDGYYRVDYSLIGRA